MAKLLHDDVFDNGLNAIKTNANKMVACSTQPTTYAEANATYALADVAMTSDDYTISNGDVSGRKLRVAAKSSVNIDSSGTYQHLALVDTVNSKLLAVTTGTSQVLTAGNTIDIPAWDIELADPT